jgi:hypothetical protein
LFADDAELSKFGSDENSIELSNKMKIEISKVANWLKVNKLSLNILKTKYIILQCKRTEIILLDIRTKPD